MSGVADQWSSLWPALAFLLAGVPLAALLDRLGFFEAVVSAVAGREADTPVLGMWVLAALTTIVLNLHTTIVLLTPLYLRFAKRADVDVMPLVVIRGRGPRRSAAGVITFPPEGGTVHVHRNFVDATFVATVPS